VGTEFVLFEIRNLII